jgi:hypothetical protein
MGENWLMEEELTAEELKDFEKFCASLWSEDPDVEIVEVHVGDENAPHGVNEEAEMNVSADTITD